MKLTIILVITKFLIVNYVKKISFSYIMFVKYCYVIVKCICIYNLIFKSLCNKLQYKNNSNDNCFGEIRIVRKVVYKL